jgi:hypothetical protein
MEVYLEAIDTRVFRATTATTTELGTPYYCIKTQYPYGYL